MAADLWCTHRFIPAVRQLPLAGRRSSGDLPGKTESHKQAADGSCVWAAFDGPGASGDGSRPSGNGAFLDGSDDGNSQCDM